MSRKEKLADIEKSGRVITKALPDTALTVADVQVRDRALFLRTGLADGDFELPDGTKIPVECAVTMNGGAIIVTITPPAEKGARSFWRSYVFQTKALIASSIEEYIKNPPTAEERK